MVSYFAGALPPSLIPHLQSYNYIPNTQRKTGKILFISQFFCTFAIKWQLKTKNYGIIHNN